MCGGNSAAAGTRTGAKPRTRIGADSNAYFNSERGTGIDDDSSGNSRKPDSDGDAAVRFVEHSDRPQLQRNSEHVELFV
jgi:hypothetical protein